jgi:hypothetical protein
MAPGRHWEPEAGLPCSSGSRNNRWGNTMGRYLLLWLLGVPLPILLLIWVFGGLH